ncbi:MAG: class I SAM-dependent methyltransferase [Bacteroidales bacterium]|nr:class I SAM-dependent methyltransferase [Bacteroidales bacterium]
MEHQLITISECPVCSSKHQNKFLESSDYFLSKKPFSINQCSDCGFLFTNPRPKDVDLPAYYDSKEYISHSNTKTGTVSKLYQLVRNYTLGKKVQLITKYIPEGKVLDIGCGTGEFLFTMQQSGFEVSGIEPNPEARKFGQEKHGLTVYPEEHLEKFQETKFEVITMWHVLEHVSDLQNRMKQLKKLLHQSGILIIAVPNPASMDAAIYKKFWAAYDLPRHLFHFRKEDIKNLANQHGFNIIKIYPMKFDSYYVSLLSEKYKTGKSNLLKAFLNGFISNLNASFANKNYSSLIYVLKHKIG